MGVAKIRRELHIQRRLRYSCIAIKICSSKRRYNYTHYITNKTERLRFRPLQENSLIDLKNTFGRVVHYPLEFLKFYN